MQRIISSGLLGLLLLWQAGCQMVIVNGKKLEGMAGIRSERPSGPNNRSPFWVKDRLDNRAQVAADQRQQDPCRIKYHSSYSVNRWMVVEGSIDNERKYPVVLDTGASVGLFLNDLHIMENKLAISPLQSSGDDSVGWGMCHLPKLHIGQLTLVNWPCFYREQHTEVQLLGLPLAKGKAVIVGLAALRKFKYVAFDSVSREVELSLEKVFEPGQLDSWAKYPFWIEEDWGGNVFLFVKIPIAGQETELQLDTGSGRGLAVANELWERMPNKIQHVKLRRGKDLYPYLGWLRCRRGVISEVEVGDRIVGNAKISVFPDDSPLVEQCSGLLGMQYFQDTVVVLDFERDLMWVKAPTAQRSVVESSLEQGGVSADSPMEFVRLAER